MAQNQVYLDRIKALIKGISVEFSYNSHRYFEDLSKFERDSSGIEIWKKPKVSEAWASVIFDEYIIVCLSIEDEQLLLRYRDLKSDIASDWSFENYFIEDNDTCVLLDSIFLDCLSEVTNFTPD